MADAVASVIAERGSAGPRYRNFTAPAAVKLSTKLPTAKPKTNGGVGVSSRELAATFRPGGAEILSRSVARSLGRSLQGIQSLVMNSVWTWSGKNFKPLAGLAR